MRPRSDKAPGNDESAGSDESPDADESAEADGRAEADGCAGSNESVGRNGISKQLPDGSKNLLHWGAEFLSKNGNLYICRII